MMFLTDENGFGHLNPLRQKSWDSQPSKHPLFHGTAWAKVLAETYQYRPRYFVGRTDGKICCLLPIMEVNSWLTGHRGVSLPFTDECEPFAVNRMDFLQLFNRAIAFGKRKNWKYLELRGGRPWLPDAPSSVQFYQHSVALHKTEVELFRRLESAVRRGIKKAEAAGLKVETNDSMGAMTEFYSLLCLTRRKHGLPPQPFKFFANLQRLVLAQGLGKIIIARQNDRPVAAAVYLTNGTEAVYKYGASDERFQYLRPNNLVMWEAVKNYARRGCTHLNLGRTSLSNHGLRRYKLGWGADETILEYFKYDLRKEGFVTGTDEAAGWHNWLFQKLPLPVSKLAGAFLYPHWA